MKLEVDKKLCDYCGTCVAVCPVDCIELEETNIKIDTETCNLCLNCVHACPLHIIAEAM
jgi:ferredoxin